MENASEPEAPRMSIQTKDLIRYTNHTIHQRKNHAKPIQKFHHNSTHSQPTTKHLDTLPADSEAPRHTPSRQRSASTHSQPTAKRLGPPPFPSNHKETQPFLHAVQRSADGSSNSRPATLALPARAYVHPHHPLPTKIKICYNTTTQQKSKITKRTITNQSHSKSKERQGKT